MVQVIAEIEGSSDAEGILSADRVCLLWKMIPALNAAVAWLKLALERALGARDDLCTERHGRVSRLSKLDANTGPIKPRVVLIMAGMAALFALLPATAYLLLAELLKSQR